LARLLIADDHPIFLDGLKTFLGANHHSVESCARSASDAMGAIARTDHDLLILDVNMGEGGGLHLLRSIRTAGNAIPVVFLTVGMKPAQTLEAIKMGINGIVLKHSDPANLLACIDAVRRGETWIDPTIIERALRHSLAEREGTILPNAGLTMRQQELIGLVAQGLRNREIAERAGLTEGTVKVHLHTIYAKLGIKSRSQLILMLASENRDN